MPDQPRARRVTEEPPTGPKQVVSGFRLCGSTVLFTDLATRRNRQGEYKAKAPWHLRRVFVRRSGASSGLHDEFASPFHAGA